MYEKEPLQASRQQLLFRRAVLMPIAKQPSYAVYDHSVIRRPTYTSLDLRVAYNLSV
jgi:hypothetical protein